MPNYIRANVPGGSYFFTVALAERSGTLLVDHIAALRAAFRSAHRALRSTWARFALSTTACCVNRLADFSP